MKKTAGLLAILAASFSASTWAASGEVAYACENGKRVNVYYEFEDDTGLPVKAVIRLKKPITVYYNPAMSDHYDSFFGNEQGYRLGAPALTINEYKTLGGVNIFNRDNMFMFQGCKPASKQKSNKHSASAKQSQGSTEVKVSYMCQNQRPLQVNYSLNRHGEVTQARVKVRGKNLNLKYDAQASDEVSIFFVAQGYRLGGGDLNASNLYQASGIMLTAPSGEILNKDCRPRS